MPILTTRRRTLAAASFGLAAAMMRPARAADAAVTIEDYAFTPEKLSVSAGTRVVFTNKDDEVHSIVSAATPPVFRSGPLDTNDSFSNVFSTPGTYAYFCSLHPHMHGTIIVT